jgi:hypothetical protein
MRALAPLLLATLVPGLIACGGSTDAGDDGPEATVRGEAPLVFLDPVDPDRPYYRSLGTVPYGTRHDLEYRMLNAGQRDVTIRSIHPSCACSRVIRIGYQGPDGAWNKGVATNPDHVLTLPAGAELEFTVRIDAGLIQPNQGSLETVRFLTDATSVEARNPNGGSFDVEINVLSEKLFTVTGDLNVGDVPVSAGGGKTVSIMRGMPQMPGSILEVVESSPGLEVDLVVIDEHADPSWQVTVYLPEGLPLGVYSGQVVVSHSGNDGVGDEGRITIPVTAQVVEDVRIYPQLLTFGGVQRGQVGTLKADLKVLLPGLRVKATRCVVQGDCADFVTATIAPLRPDDEGRDVYWNLELTCAADAPLGRFTGALVVHLEDEQYPSVRAPIGGVVLER